MSNVALPTRTIGDVVTIVESVPNIPAGNVYHTTSPQDAQPPFVVITPFAPVQIGAGLCAEDWGKLAAQFRVVCYGATGQQALNLRRDVLTTPTVPWGDDWALDQTSFSDQAHATPNPEQWLSAFTITEVDHG